MPGDILDFLFGSSALKKAAAGTPSGDQNSAPPANPSGIDMQAEAAKAAARSKPAAAPAPAAPAKPITVTKKKPTTVEQGVGSQLMNTK